MNSPTCSIIIPTYNHGKYIERSVECALGQTYQNVEVIVVDDGSADDTAERVKRFGNRIKYIKKQNSGRGDSRNRALTESSGKYIQFLDADDTIEPEKLERQIAVLEANDEFGVIYSDCSSNDSLGEYCGNVSYPLQTDEDPLPILLNRTLFGIHAAITRREAILAVGMFDPHPLAQEDWDLWLRLALHGFRFKYLPGDLAHYDQTGSSTVVNAPLMYRRAKHMLERYLADPQFRELDRNVVNRFAAYQNLHLGTRAYNNRWWSASRKHFLAVARSDKSLLTLRNWSCIPRSLLHEVVDILRGRATRAPGL